MLMRRIAPLILLATLALAACSAPNINPDPDTTDTPTPTLEADTNCITVTDAVTAALQGGIDEKGAGYTIDRIAAIPNDAGDAWWVAADLTGEPDVTAAWYTQQDPATASDAVFVSATELASLTSIYALPEDLTGADPINEAIACLDQ